MKFRYVVVGYDAEAKRERMMTQHKTLESAKARFESDPKYVRILDLKTGEAVIKR